MAFTFDFSDNDIEASDADAIIHDAPQPAKGPQPSAFPVAGKPQFPPACHDVSQMLSSLPSKISYSVLEVDLDGRGTVSLPRRELWDVRVQLMAEDDIASTCNVDAQSGEAQSGLGTHDVKTGIYEGGFKSWESSIDLVKVLYDQQVQDGMSHGSLGRIIELGCGTALPSLALFTWVMSGPRSDNSPVSFTLADYNQSVLRLVTLPNFLLTWAICERGQNPLVDESLAVEGELELTPPLLEAFQTFLRDQRIDLVFLSGGWSPEFVQLLYDSSTSSASEAQGGTLVLGAETIYSPSALELFATTVFGILSREAIHKAAGQATALVGAKKLYFGVGGSLDDFVARMRGFGVVVAELREETEGIRRGVVSCSLG